MMAQYVYIIIASMVLSSEVWVCLAILHIFDMIEAWFIFIPELSS